MAEGVLSSRTVAMAELVLLMLLFNVMVWFLGPKASSPSGALIYLGVMLVIAIHVIALSRHLYPLFPEAASGLAPMKHGFLRGDTWRAGAQAYSLAILAGCGLIFAAGRMTGMANNLDLNIGDIALKFARYLMFAAVQAYVYFEFLRPRLALILGARSSPPAVALMMAGLFMVVHAPNPYLMLATPIAGFVWSLLYASFPNYFWVVLSHAILGTCVQILTSWPIRIGASFWNPDFFALRSALKQVLAMATNQ